MSGVAGTHLESVLENEIAEHLAGNGWLYSPTDAGYDRELALFSEDVLGWLEDSQPTGFTKVVRPDDTDAQPRLANTGEPLDVGGRLLSDRYHYSRSITVGYKGAAPALADADFI